VTPDSIRHAVEIQPTIGQGVIALIRGVAYLCDNGEGETFSASVAQDEKAWSDAVLANTPQAMETATLVAPVPSDVADALAPPTAPPAAPDTMPGGADTVTGGADTVPGGTA